MMTIKTMPLCVICRKTMEEGYDLAEVPGTTTTKTKCALCSANSYGGVWTLAVRKEKKRDKA